ncbi:MAG: beta-lactamase family protein [Candidatus Eremiobacteraeota bacterium]|nr:beta-lactamase family protein [Candidatus Eremiobacteraeota bacterium]
MKRIIACGWFVTALLLATLPIQGAYPVRSNAGLSSKLRADLTQYVKTYGKKEHLSAVSFSASFHNDPMNIDLAVGTTRLGRGVAVTPSNLFQIGSNTKAFTAVAILQLEAAGKLSIHDTVGKWLPQYPAWRKITIQQLLNMTSGIPTYDLNARFQAAVAAHPNHTFTVADLVAYVYPHFKPPGKQWEYSNTSYILAQMVIAKAAASHSFRAEINRIIASVGLRNTFYEPEFYSTSVTSRLVAGYFWANGSGYEGYAPFLGMDTSRYSLSWLQGAGGIVGTPDDLATWARALYHDTALLAPAQRAELMSLVSTKTGHRIARTSARDPAGFGLGVTQGYDKNLGAVWSYLGGTLGFRAIYDWFPSRDVVVAIMINSYPSVDHIGTAIASLTGTLKKAGKL